MTDQNSLARSYTSDMMEDDDPLAELARIVSGQSTRKGPAPVRAANPVPVAEALPAEPAAPLWADHSDTSSMETAAFDDELRAVDAPQASWNDAPHDFHEASPAPLQPDDQDMGFDLESELMRELGGDEAEAPSSISDMLSQLEEPLVETDHAAVDYQAETVSEPQRDLSLEDQLMAELGFSGDEPVVEQAPVAAPVQATTQVHPQTAMAQPSKGWTRATPVAEKRQTNPVSQPTPVEFAHAPITPDDLGGDLENEFANMFAEKSTDDAHFQVQDEGFVPAAPFAPEPQHAEVSDLDTFADQFLGEEAEQEFVAQPSATPAQADDDFDFNFDAAFAEELAAEVPPASTPVPPAAAAKPRMATMQQQPAAVAARHSQPEPQLPDLDDQFASAFEEELSLADDAPLAEEKAPVWKRFASGFSSRRNARSENVDSDIADDLPPVEMELPIDEASYDPELDEPDAPVLGRKSSNGFRIAGLALFGALVLGLGAVSYAYFSGGAPTGEPVVIKADNEPVKVKPADPGGAEVANQDKAAYERVTGEFGGDTKQEKLVSGTEAPVDIENETTTNTVADNQAIDVKADERLTPQPDEAALTPVSAALEPRKVRTMAVLPDGTVVAPSEAPQTTEGAALEPIDGPVETAALADPAAPVVKEAAVAPATAKPAKVPGTPVATAKPKVDADAPVQIAPAPQAEPTQTASVQRSEWAVQVASQRSAEEANAAFSNLKRKFPSILDGRQMAVQRADIEGKGVFFRVRMQAESKEEAVRLCERLKSAGGSCFVTR